MVAWAGAAVEQRCRGLRGYTYSPARPGMRLACRVPGRCARRLEVSLAAGGEQNGLAARRDVTFSEGMSSSLYRSECARTSLW